MYVGDKIKAKNASWSFKNKISKIFSKIILLNIVDIL